MARNRLGEVLFLLAMTVGLVAPASARVEETWREIVRSTGEGSRLVGAYALAEEGGALWLGCGPSPTGSHGGLSALVTTGALLGGGAMPVRLTVVRFDRAKPQLQSWGYAHRSAGPSDWDSVERFLTGLSGSSEIVVQVSDYRLKENRLSFRLEAEQTRKTMARLRAACRVAGQDN